MKDCTAPPHHWCFDGVQPGNPMVRGVCKKCFEVTEAPAFGKTISPYGKSKYRARDTRIMPRAEHLENVALEAAAIQQARYGGPVYLKDA